MTTLMRALSAFMAAGLCFLWLPAQANMAPMQEFRGGGVVAPDNPHESIRLDSEEVVIRLKTESYEVDAVFHLFNTGETTTEWTGFPKWSAPRAESHPIFIRFEGSVNGSPIKFNDEGDLSDGDKLLHGMSTEQRMESTGKSLKKEKQWLASQVTFPGHSETIIRVKYEAPYFGKGSRASYIYGTGSLWKDNIGKAVFIIDSSELGLLTTISTKFVDRLEPGKISPVQQFKPRLISDCVLKYELRNFKPYPDAFLQVNLPLQRFIRTRGPHPPPPMPMPTRIK